MIYDIPTVKSYIAYKRNRGPFVIIFFYPDEFENKNLFFKVRKISEIYKGVPVLRFYWIDFIKEFPFEIESYNYIYIIEKNKKINVQKYIDDTNIYSIFKYANNKYLEYKKSTNKSYITLRRKTLKPFRPTCFQWKNSRKTKQYIENDESEYTFPNSTAVFPHKRYIENQKKIAVLNKINRNMNKNIKLKQISNNSTFIRQTSVNDQEINNLFFGVSESNQIILKPLQHKIYHDTHTSINILKPIKITKVKSDISQTKTIEVNSKHLHNKVHENTKFNNVNINLSENIVEISKSQIFLNTRIKSRCSFSKDNLGNDLPINLCTVGLNKSPQISYGIYYS